MKTNLTLTPKKFARSAALETLRNSDARLDSMLKALRDATQPDTLDRRVLVAHLEKRLSRFDIRIPTAKARLAAAKARGNAALARLIDDGVLLPAEEFAQARGVSRQALGAAVRRGTVLS